MVMQFAVILSQGRTGSTLLLRILNQIEGAHFSGENDRAFDHLLRFLASCGFRRTEDAFSQLAWKPITDGVTILGELQALVQRLYAPARLAGFKEIRYGKESYEDLESDVAGLKWLMPDLKIVFNVRDTETCVQSGWWVDNPTESIVMLETMRANFARYHQLHGDTYWLPYEELKQDSPVLQGLFAFLSVDFKEHYLEPLKVVLK